MNLRVMRRFSSTESLAASHVTPPLAPPEGDVGQSALPGHPGGQGLDLILVHRGMKADPALARPPPRAVNDPVALERAHQAIVHHHRERDRDDLLRGEQPFRHSLPPGEAVDIGNGVVELGPGDGVGVEVFGHWVPPIRCASSIVATGAGPGQGHRSRASRGPSRFRPAAAVGRRRERPGWECGGARPRPATGSGNGR